MTGTMTNDHPPLRHVDRGGEEGMLIIIMVVAIAAVVPIYSNRNGEECQAAVAVIGDE